MSPCLEMLASAEITIAALRAQIAQLEAERDKAYDIGMETFAAFMFESHEIVDGEYAIDVEGQEAIKEWATLATTEEAIQLRHKLFDRIRNPTNA